jgi:hypothetical protein
MSHANFSSPREAARAFTPKLAAFVDDTLYPKIWNDPALALRDRSLITVAALIAEGHLDELPSHLRRALANGGRLIQVGILAGADSLSPPADHGNGHEIASARGKARHGAPFPRALA